jgi:hypothetical protein
MLAHPKAAKLVSQEGISGIKKNQGEKKGGKKIKWISVFEACAVCESTMTMVRKCRSP